MAKLISLSNRVVVKIGIPQRFIFRPVLFCKNNDSEIDLLTDDTTVLLKERDTLEL